VALRLRHGSQRAAEHTGSPGDQQSHLGAIFSPAVTRVE
jgi:hypothetical protein